LEQIGHTFRILRSTPLNIIPTRQWTSDPTFGGTRLMLSQPRSRRFMTISGMRQKKIPTNCLSRILLLMVAVRSSGRASCMPQERSNDELVKFNLNFMHFNYSSQIIFCLFTTSSPSM
jgi:hypothetical protein